MGLNIKCLKVVLGGVVGSLRSVSSLPGKLEEPKRSMLCSELPQSRGGESWEEVLFFLTHEKISILWLALPYS